MTGTPKKAPLMPVADALALITRDLDVLATEMVPVAEAVGRVLAAPLAARRSQPGADMSAMDGYAFAYPDTLDIPLTLKVVGESAAGRAFDGAVGPGEATRIFTGGVVPPGADTVVIQENTTREGESVTITVPLAKGRNVRRRALISPPAPPSCRPAGG